MPTDPAAYYTDFWLYASYYGEAAARLYYTQWSPPEGTLPPAGTVLPTLAADVSHHCYAKHPLYIASYSVVLGEIMPFFCALFCLL